MSEKKKKLNSNAARLSVSVCLLFLVLALKILNCSVQSSFDLHAGNFLLHSNRCESCVNAGGDELLRVRGGSDIFGIETQNFA